MIRIKLISWLLHLNEQLIFYPKLRRFYKHKIKKDNPLIIDVGSNKGQTIDFFLKMFKNPVIYGFEPNRELYLYLCEKYKSNSNISIRNYGISNRDGKLIFKETITSETSTFEELNPDSHYLKMKSHVLGIKPENMVKSAYEVEVITLSGFIKKNSLSDIDIIKIDTEGHEYKCLQGLFDDNVINAGFIQLEQHNDDMYINMATEETISKLLAGNNYCLYKKITHGFGDFDEVIYIHTNHRHQASNTVRYNE